MNEQQAQALLKEDEETDSVYVSDKYLVEASTSEYNFKADNEVALGLELGRDTIYSLKGAKPMTAAQKLSVDLYNRASVATRANSSSPGGDVIVSKVSEAVEPKEIATEAVQAMEALSDRNEATLKAVSKAHSALLEKLIDSTVSSVEKVCDDAVNAFEHYAKVAGEISSDLKNFKRVLVKEIDQAPRAQVFEYGSYSRFFQVAGVPITDFKQYAEVLGTLKSTIQFSHYCGIPLAESNARTCLDGLRRLQASGRALSADEYETIVDRIRDNTLDVWKNARSDNPHMALAAYKYKVPSALPVDSKAVGAITGFFDNNTLLWSAPVDYNFMEATRAQRVDLFGASLVRDVALDKLTAVSERPKGFDVPSNEDLIKAIDVACEALAVVARYKSTAGVVKSLKPELKSTLETLTKLVKSGDSDMTVASYTPLTTACIQAFTQPHVKLNWLAVRAAIMLAGVCEVSTQAAGKYSKYAQASKSEDSAQSSQKLLVKLDVELEPEQTAAKEIGYFTNLLLKLKKS